MPQTGLLGFFLSPSSWEDAGLNQCPSNESTGGRHADSRVIEILLSVGVISFQYLKCDRWSTGLGHGRENHLNRAAAQGDRIDVWSRPEVQGTQAALESETASFKSVFPEWRGSAIPKKNRDAGEETRDQERVCDG